MSNEAENLQGNHLGQQVEGRDGKMLCGRKASLPKWDIVLGIVCGVAVVFVWLLWSGTQVVREDELLHLHDAWLVGQGSLPYRDFFEHHACWYHFLLGPAAAFFKPEADREAAVLFVNFARGLSLLVVLAGLGLLVWIGRLWREWRLGLLALVLLSGVPFFLETAIETRPDVPAFVLWMGALVLLHSVVGGRKPVVSGWWWSAEKLPQAVRCSFLWSGVFLGSAVMFTQKMLFALPGLGFAIGLWVCMGGVGSFSDRLRQLLRWVFGLVVPVWFTWLYFFANGAGVEFVDKVFLINARWAHRESPWIFYDLFLPESWLFLGLGIVGAVWVLVRSYVKRRMDWFGGMFVASALGWFVGLLWIIPVTDRQFYMISLPLLALLAAYGVLEWLRYWPRWLRPPILLGIVFFVVVEPLYFTSWNRIYSIRKWHNPMDGVLWVIDNTEPSASFLDGWTGAGVFRPQAWYYGFVHSEIPSMIPAEDREALMRGLESGAIYPQLIANDPRLLELHPRLPGWVFANYQQVPGRRLWRRKFADDEGVVSDVVDAYSR